MDIKRTPKSEGYIFPAEWEQHIATWLTYPKENESWPDNFELVKQEYHQFIQFISKSEKVKIITDDWEHSHEIKMDLEAEGIDLDFIEFYPLESNDSWCRDHGPAFVKKLKTGEKAIVNWEYNAWGCKYPYDKDNQIGNKIASIYNLPVYTPGIVMEGGSIEVNGCGDLLTTRACLLNPNRNPALNQKEIEKYLNEFYGTENIIWLNDGIIGDDTDGHIDDIARFTDEETIVAMIENDKTSPNYQICKENIEILDRSKLYNKKSPNIIELPLPEQRFLGSDPLPCSYANFYITNKYVIVPVFRSKYDEIALNILQKCFPKKEIKGLYSENVIFGLGSWHCLSQQEII